MAKIQKKQFLVMVCLATVVYGLSFSPWMKYLNFPIYDFSVTSLPQQKTAPVVALITTADITKVSKYDLDQFYEFVAELTPKGILFLSYPGEPNDVLLKMATTIPNVHFGQASSPDIDYNLVKHPIPNWVNESLSVSPVLLPSADTDGIIRGFDPKKYHQYGLTCTECKIAKEFNADDTETKFLINYRLNQGSLPILRARDLIQNVVPRSILKDKYLVIANDLSQSSGIYSTAITKQQRISFPYYVSSVIDSIINSDQIKQVNHWVLLTMLLSVALFVLFIFQYCSNRQMLLLCILALPVFYLTNLVSLSQFNIFIPAVEPMVIFVGAAITITLFRETQATKTLQSMTSAIELQLSDIGSFQPVSPADQCASLVNLFNRVVDIKGFKLFEFKGESSHEVISFSDCADSPIIVQFSDSQLRNFVEPIPYLLKSDSDIASSLYVGIPISRAKHRVGIIVLEIESTNIASLTELYEEYRDEIFEQVKQWLVQNKVSSSVERLNEKMHQPIDQRLDVLVDRLLGQHDSIKQNFNALISTAVVYDIYGALVSLNSAAERFAKRAGLIWYDRPLSDVLQGLTQWSALRTNELINAVLLTKEPQIFSVKAGAHGDYLATLSIDTLQTEDQGQRMVEKTLLTLEIGNVSKISHASRLKHTYIISLTDQVKHDLSKAITLIEKKSYTENDIDKYEDLLSILDSLGGRLKSSKTYVADLANIDNRKIYPVDVANIAQSVLTELENQFSDKGVKLIFHRPAFLSLITLDYRELTFVISYLTELLLKDSVKNSKLEISITEKNIGHGSFISLTIVSSGYGLPMDLLSEQRSEDDEFSRSLDRCKKFSLINGGRFNIDSQTGKGIKVDIDLPLKGEIH